MVLFDTDEHPRADTTLEGLGRLKPVFKKGGTVTAGNASGLNDAGSCIDDDERRKRLRSLGLRALWPG